MDALPEKHRVYVIQNPSGRFYIGLSDDIERRVANHNSGVSKWTRARGPWVLAWVSEWMSLGNARRLENELKRQKGGSGFYERTGLNRRGS